MPQNMQVAFRDFDMGEFEINNFITNVFITDFNENKKDPIKFNRNDGGTEHELRSGKLVILS